MQVSILLCTKEDARTCLIECLHASVFFWKRWFRFAHDPVRRTAAAVAARKQAVRDAARAENGSLLHKVRRIVFVLPCHCRGLWCQADTQWLRARVVAIQLLQVDIMRENMALLQCFEHIVNNLAVYTNRPGFEAAPVGDVADDDAEDGSNSNGDNDVAGVSSPVVHGTSTDAGVDNSSGDAATAIGTT